MHPSPETDNEYAANQVSARTSLTSRSSLQQSPRWIVNISMARWIVKSATDILRSLLTSNTRALSGMAPRRQRRFFLMYGRMQLIPSGLVTTALAYRFRTHSIRSQSRITPRLEDLTRGSRNLNQVLHLPDSVHDRRRLPCFGSGARTHKVTTDNYEFTGGLKGNLGEFGDYFKTWNWETGFRYSEDRRVSAAAGCQYRCFAPGVARYQPATAFNPFGLNQNSPAVINKIFATTHHLGTTSLTLEDLKLIGDLFNLPAGPISFAVGGEHRTERTSDQPDALIASGQTIAGPPDFCINQGEPGRLVHLLGASRPCYESCLELSGAIQPGTRLSGAV